MINEHLIDEAGVELSIHFNSDNNPVVVIDHPLDATLVYQLTKEDAEWMIKRLSEIINDINNG